MSTPPDATGAQVEDARVLLAQRVAVVVALPLSVVTGVGLLVGDAVALWLSFAALDAAVVSAALLLRAPRRRRRGVRTALPYLAVLLGALVFVAARDALLGTGVGAVAAAVGGAAAGLGLALPAALDVLRHRPVG
ncbi:hypothetical protein WDZ17_05550 [Pseudokineococcus basanitobsidens]|uniref:Uncharacterized protein n=1 Tax=Pseudokineococcus basanitobsidens TaxID=1926649 RepID=A0ABU8RI55_9ACTN